MNVRTFWVRAMEYMCAHIQGFWSEWCISTMYHAWDTPFWSGTLDIRPQFILSSERVLGDGVRTYIDSQGKIPSTWGSHKGRTHNTIVQDSEPNMVLTGLFRPRTGQSNGNYYDTCLDKNQFINVTTHTCISARFSPLTTSPKAASLELVMLP